MTGNVALPTHAIRHAPDGADDLSPYFYLAGSPGRSAGQPGPLKPNPSTVVSTFQTGHGWTVNGTTTAVNLNDTTDFELGTQAAVFSAATTSNANLDSAVLSAVNVTTSVIRLLIKIENMAGIGNLRFIFGDSTFSNYTNVNINFLETRPTGSYYQDSAWTWITVMPVDGSTTGSGAKSAVTKWRVQATALSGQTVRVHVGAVFVLPVSTTFPNGVATFCFDDGRATAFNNAKPIMDALGMRASIYPIIDRIATVAGGEYCTLAQLQQWRNYSGAEVGVHSAVGVDHDAGFDTLTPTHVETVDMLPDREYLYQNGLGNGEGFAWPLGTYTAPVLAAAAKLTAYGRLNTTSAHEETWPPEDPMRIRSYAVGPTSTLATAKSFMDNAKAGGGWACYTFHEITPLGTGTLEWSISNFQALANYAVSIGQPVLPILDVMKHLS
jgi:polysaccharide deacetylase